MLFSQRLRRITKIIFCVSINLLLTEVQNIMLCLVYRGNEKERNQRKEKVLKFFSLHLLVHPNPRVK